MALAATTVWEVRSSPGNDLNGGAWVPGAGVDYSQQNFAQVVFDGVTITATTAGTGATITITGYTVSNDDTNNILNITGGTNFTAGSYQISSVNTGANTWTLDRNCTSGAGSGMTGRMGGAKQTIDTTIDLVVAGNTVWCTGTFAEAVTTSVTGSTSAPIKVKGYGSVRGDTGRATITGSNSRSRCVDMGASVNYYDWYNFIFTAATSALFGTRDSLQWTFFNCEMMKGSGSIPIGSILSGFSGAGMVFWNCQVHDLTSFAGRAASNCSGSFIYNIGATPFSAPNFFGGLMFNDNIIANITGWGVVIANNSDATSQRNIFYNCSSGGIQINGSSNGGVRILNNILVSNGTKGIEVTNVPSGDIINFIVGHNAFFGQTTPQNTARYPVYLGNDVTLSSDPFTNAGSLDFSIDATGNTEMTGFRFPNNFGSPNTQYGVMGPIQPQGGSSGIAGGSFTYSF